MTLKYFMIPANEIPSTFIKKEKGFLLKGYRRLPVNINRMLYIEQ